MKINKKYGLFGFVFDFVSQFLCYIKEIKGGKGAF
jgi:hypothetical protein